MSTITFSSTDTSPAAWKEYEKALFRFFFSYFLLQVLPLDWKFYSYLFSIHWLHLQYADIFNLAHYTPDVTGRGQHYVNWAIIALIALAGAVTWGQLEKRGRHYTDYDALYYWLRVAVRYRLAIALLAYGLIKFFPLQSPYPSISNLNTAYGYFSEWKLFSMSLGIVPSYERFLGLVEIVAALLLLYRKTATIGAFIVVLFTGNVFMSNLAYGGGEHVYSLYLVTLALFLLVFDGQRLISLLAFGKPTAPNRYRFPFSLPWLRYGRIALKGFVLLFFIILYGGQVARAYYHDPYRYPNTPALSGAAGIYNVREFRINSRPIPYSPTDPVRWQDVVFERWATISIRSNRPVIIDSNNVEKIAVSNKSRTYELEGAGNRHYYGYTADTLAHVLTLQNRNRHYSGEKWVFHYDRQGDSTIILRGVNEKNDSAYAVLDRINKKYLLHEAARQGRGRAIKL